MRGDIKKLAIRGLVVRALAGREMYGFEIQARLRTMGIHTGTNYLYEILTGMERDGILEGRWASNPSGKPRRHYYGLGKGGQEELDRMVRESIDLIQEKLLLNSPKGSPETFKKILASISSPAPRGIVIVALPDGSPAVSYQLHVRGLIGSLPRGRFYVVKPAKTHFYDPPTGVTILDGRRDDMPLKDGFADFLLLPGIPRHSSLEGTFDECARVLNAKGHLLLKQPNSLTEERAPQNLAGYEQYSKLVYETYDNDRMVSLREVMRTLSKRFASVSEKVFGGSTWIHACRKTV